MEGNGLIRKLQPILPRTSLLTIYKSIIRPHLDYGDVVYDQPSNDAVSNKLGTVQHNAALAITGARIRVRISSTKRMDETPLPILQSCFN